VNVFENELSPGEDSSSLQVPSNLLRDISPRLGSEEPAPIRLYDPEFLGPLRHLDADVESAPYDANDRVHYSNTQTTLPQSPSTLSSSEFSVYQSKGSTISSSSSTLDFRPSPATSESSLPSPRQVHPQELREEAFPGESQLRQRSLQSIPPIPTQFLHVHVPMVQPLQATIHLPRSCEPVAISRVAPLLQCEACDRRFARQKDLQ
jgi:hypothetical protein